MITLHRRVRNIPFSNSLSDSPYTLLDLSLSLVTLTQFKVNIFHSSLFFSLYRGIAGTAQ
jgi:hypothetical protein